MKLLSNQTKYIVEYGNNIAFDFVKNAQMWIERDNRNEVLLFGAGSHVRWVLSFMRKYNIPIKMILDSRRVNSQTKIDGIPVVSFEKLCSTLNDSVDNHKWFVISAPSAADSITAIIKQNFPSALITSCDMQMYSQFIPDIQEYRNYLIRNWDEFNLLFDCFEDDFSRKTLQNVLLGRITGDYRYYQYCYAPAAYYQRDIIHFQDNEVMVELGGYDGETLKEFINQCPNYKTAYCFEPDKKLIPKLKQIKENQFQLGKRVEIIDKGAWDKEGVLYFSTDNVGEDTGRIVNVQDGKELMAINVTSVDSTVLEPISFMKLDVEGSELRALMGAEQQISRNKPKLAVSVYHKPEDFLNIWKFLKSLVPEYKYYLRHHTQFAGTDTILYAVMD